MGEAPARLDRGPYELDLDERFDGPVLDERVWLASYLPQWSSRARSAARYAVGGATGGSGLVLRIDDDQVAWAPEWDGPIRVSGLQTGVSSGPVGSSIGQHHFRPDLAVREAQRPERRYLLHHGLVELRAHASRHPAALSALWLIGFEDVPEHSAEICVMEVFGRDIERGATRVGLGVHPFGDPRIRDDFAAVELPIDPSEPHTYSAEWRADGVRFFVDEKLVRSVDQAPDYPMQLMLNVYDLAGGGGGSEAEPPPDTPPKSFAIDWVRTWRPRTDATR